MAEGEDPDPDTVPDVKVDFVAEAEDSSVVEAEDAFILEAEDEPALVEEDEDDSAAVTYTILASYSQHMSMTSSTY